MEAIVSIMAMNKMNCAINHKSFRSHIDYRSIGRPENDQKLSMLTDSFELALFNTLLCDAFSSETPRGVPVERHFPLVRQGNEILILSNGQWEALQPVSLVCPQSLSQVL